MVHALERPQPARSVGTASTPSHACARVPPAPSFGSPGGAGYCTLGGQRLRVAYRPWVSQPPGSSRAVPVPPHRRMPELDPVRVVENRTTRARRPRLCSMVGHRSRNSGDRCSVRWTRRAMPIHRRRCTAYGCSTATFKGALNDSSPSMDGSGAPVASRMSGRPRALLAPGPPPPPCVPRKRQGGGGDRRRKPDDAGRSPGSGASVRSPEQPPDRIRCPRATVLRRQSRLAEPSGPRAHPAPRCHRPSRRRTSSTHASAGQQHATGCRPCPARVGCPSPRVTREPSSYTAQARTNASASSAGRVKSASWLPGVSMSSGFLSRWGKRGAQAHSPGRERSSVDRT